MASVEGDFCREIVGAAAGAPLLAHSAEPAPAVSGLYRVGMDIRDCEVEGNTRGKNHVSMFRLPTVGQVNGWCLFGRQLPQIPQARGSNYFFRALVVPAMNIVTLASSTHIQPIASTGPIGLYSMASTA